MEPIENNNNSSNNTNINNSTNNEDRKFVEGEKTKTRTRALTIGTSRNVTPDSTTPTNVSASPPSSSSSPTTTPTISISNNNDTQTTTTTTTETTNNLKTSSDEPIVQVQIGSPPKKKNTSFLSTVKAKSNVVVNAVVNPTNRKKVEYDTNDNDNNGNRIVAVKNKDNNNITVIVNNTEPPIVHDSHGFVVDNFADELQKFEKVEEEKSHKKLEDWTNFNEQYKHIGLCTNPKQLRKLLSQGIPHEIRFSLWKLYSGAAEKQRKEEIALFKQQKEEKLKRIKGMGTIRGLTPPTQRKSYYQHLHHIIKTSNRYSTRLQSIPEIDKDISRTFPGHAFFESEEGQRKLTRVLQAYSIRNRKVGYCQSMNIVAGYLLYVMKKNEEDAFWLLSSIVEDYCSNYYSTNLLGAQVDMLVFDHLTKSHLPVLYNHLTKCGVSLTLLSTKWFMCLYIGILPNEIVLRIWDHLFVECGIYGYDKPNTESEWLENKDQVHKCLGIASYNLLLTGLAILSFMEESLLKINSTPQILLHLSNYVKGIFNAKKLFKKYYYWREKISKESFSELKIKSEETLIQELEDMRKIRDLTATAKITRFSKSDLEKIWDGFRNLNLSMKSSRISMGKSLKLDFSIFKKVFQYIMPGIDASSKEVLISQLFKVFDKNKDGSLDFSELMSGLCILAKGTSEERLKLYFSFFDGDNSGFVTKEEMKLMLQTVYEKIELDPLAVMQYTIEEYVDIVFSNLGIEDDQLSFDNFRQAILSYPRIFRCFMLEEETFIIEDFEDDDAPQQQPTDQLSSDEDNSNNKNKNNNNKNKNNKSNNDNVTSDDSDDNGSGGEKKSKSKLNFSQKPTNQLKTSTFKSSLIQAIENAQKEQVVNDQTVSPRPNTDQKSPNSASPNNSNFKPSNNSSSSSPSSSNNNSSFKPSNNNNNNGDDKQQQQTQQDSNNNQTSSTTTRSQNNNTVNRRSMVGEAIKPEGQPLSCCKFM